MLHLVPFNMANPPGGSGIDRAPAKEQEPGQLLTAKHGGAAIGRAHGPGWHGRSLTCRLMPPAEARPDGGAVTVGVVYNSVQRRPETKYKLLLFNINIGEEWFLLINSCQSIRARQAARLEAISVPSVFWNRSAPR